MNLKFLALGIIVVAFISVSVGATASTVSISFTKDLSKLAIDHEVWYSTEFNVCDSIPATWVHPGTWEITYSDIDVKSGWVQVDVYTPDLSNYLFSIEFKDNKQLVLSYYAKDTLYHRLVLGNWTAGNKVVAIYNARQLIIKLYNNDKLINSTTIDDIAVRIKISKTGICLVATDIPTCHASGTMTVKITYIKNTQNTQQNTQQVQEAVKQTTKTVTNTAVQTITPLAGLGMLFAFLRKLEGLAR